MCLHFEAVRIDLPSLQSVGYKEVFNGQSNEDLTWDLNLEVGLKNIFLSTRRA